MEYQIKMLNMPTSIRALTVMNEDGSFTIFINCRLSFEQQKKSFLHELEHINNNDFDKMISVDTLEHYAHERTI